MQFDSTVDRSSQMLQQSKEQVKPVEIEEVDVGTYKESENLNTSTRHMVNRGTALGGDRYDDSIRMSVNPFGSFE